LVFKKNVNCFPPKIAEISDHNVDPSLQKNQFIFANNHSYVQAKLCHQVLLLLYGSGWRVPDRRTAHCHHGLPDGREHLALRISRRGAFPGGLPQSIFRPEQNFAKKSHLKSINIKIFPNRLKNYGINLLWCKILPRKMADVNKVIR
jgi:hypothetical protein